MKIWPFAIAVGKYEDYDFVIRPDFFTDETKNIWRQSAFRANQPSSDVRRFRAKLGGNRDIEFIYRTSQITTATGDVLDSAGRPIFKSVGFIIQDQCTLSDAEIAALLESSENEFRPIINEYIKYVSPPLWRPQMIGPRNYPPSPPPPPWPPLLVALLVSLLLNLALSWACYQLWFSSSKLQGDVVDLDAKIGALDRQNKRLQQTIQERQIENTIPKSDGQN